MHASQKQALSYTHNIVSVDSDNRLCTPEAVHSALSVEIPDPDTNLELFQLVKKFMVHGPCGIHSPNAPYMDKPRSAPKTFPSPFKTIPISEDSYAVLCCHDTGRSFEYNIIWRSTTYLESKMSPRMKTLLTP